MNKLLFIRHGETSINEQGLTHKTNDHANLTIQGKSQIEATAKVLGNLEIELIVCSDEPRTIESARIIAKLLNLTFTTDSTLKERNWGELEGKAWSEIKAILDKLTLSARYSYIPPQGESWQEFEERLFETIESLVSNHPDKNIAIITHGGVIRAIIPRLLNLPKEESFKYDISNASITIITYNNGLFEAELINDTSHLTV